jgi:DNA-binding MarR family transcriptional regulator
MNNGNVIPRDTPTSARRAQSREDRRANVVELTTKGRRSLKRAELLMDECERAFVAALGPDERDLLAKMMERLLVSNTVR